MEALIPDSAGDFETELPTLECAKICGSCGPRFGRACVDSYSDEVSGSSGAVASVPWDEEKTEPQATPGFLRGFDDDFVLDPNLGGEG